MLDMKGTSAQLVGGSLLRDGVKLGQNGEWDDNLLCDDHEKELGAGDDYAIDFCRTWRNKGRPRTGDRALDVPNPEPDKLVHFAYGVVWRHVQCQHGRANGLKLGPYGDDMLEEMQNRGPYSLQLFVGRNPLTLQGQHVDIAVGPYRVRMDAWSVWHFTIAGLDFYLKTDRRSFPDSWLPYLGNGNDPIVIGQTAERGMHEVPKLFPVLRRMRRTTWKG